MSAPTDYQTAEVMGAAFKFFEALYQNSDTAACVLKPEYDGECLVDVSILTMNPVWQNARRVETFSGIRGSDAYSGFHDDILPAVRRAFSDGRAAHTFTTPADDDIMCDTGDVVLLEWRLLPNGYVIETGKAQTLLADLVEAAGPILIADLNRFDKHGVPTHLLAVNDSFREMFLPGVELEIPTIAAYANGSSLPLAVIRDQVRALQPNNDWKHFFDVSAAGYRAGEAVDVPFVLNGAAYLMDYRTKLTSDSRLVGIWTYRPASLEAIEHLDEFRNVRLRQIGDLVEDLRRPIAAHQPLFDGDDNVIDLELVWANAHFQGYRREPLPAGALASETRLRFVEDFLPYIAKAWAEGTAVQYFNFNPSDEQHARTLYRDDHAKSLFWDGVLEIETTFSRTDDGFIIEWGDDVDAKIQLGSDLETQRRAALQEVSRASAEVASRAEHDRFTRELHDNILQELFVVGLTISPHLDDDAAPNGQLLRSVNDAVTKISKDIRRLISDSKPQTAEPLTRQVAALVDQWQAATDGFDVTADIFSVLDDVTLERLPTTAVENMLFVVKEAVANAVKHSGGQRVDVQLFIAPQAIHLTVTDDGAGIDPRNTRNSGTLNMEARVAAINGSLTTTSTADGVTIEVAAPYELEAL